MKSYWNFEEKRKEKFPKLEKNLVADVCIIGGGLTGLSTAYYLAKEGLNVTVLEKDRICSHTSGGSTGKITSQHGLIYNYLKDEHGKDVAKKYYEANEQAIKNIENIIKKEKIDCDYEKKSAYVYTEAEKEVENIKNELEATKKLKIDAEYTTEIDLPIDILGGIEFKNQAQFHPTKYGYGLVKSVLKNNGQIFENSKVIDVEEYNDNYIVRTQNGAVVSKYVVLTTRYPIITFPGYYFIKMYQSTSYAIIVDTHTKLVSNGFFINVENPQFSFRTVKDGKRNLLLVVGYDYKTGTEIIGNPFEYLEARVKKMYPEAEIIEKWTAEDCITLDKIPYIGEFSKVMENIYVATGFNKWGITSSNIAANIITDKIFNKKNEYEEIFKSSRLEMIKNKEEMKNMMKEAGDGIVLERIKGKATPTCTHLGCKLSWNPIEETWDCACHGSRFTKEGEVIESPAIEHLKEKSQSIEKNAEM